MRFWSPSALRSGVKHWKEITPEPLHKAIEALRRKFAENAWKAGEIMRQGCHPALHPGMAEQARTISDGLKKLGYSALLTVDGGHAEPTVFTECFDRCAELLAKEAGRTFSDLFDIASAQSELLSTDPVEWASLQTKVLIADESHRIPLWTKDACDKQPYDPSGDADELLHWRNWRAPRWFFMQPFANWPYNRATAWERMDEGESERVLEEVEDRFNQRLVTALEKAVDETHVRLAKQMAQRTPAAQRLVHRPAFQSPFESVTRAEKVNGPRSIADRWQGFRENFQALAEEERRAGAAQKDRFLRAHCSYGKHPEVFHEYGRPEYGPYCLLQVPECGLWFLSDGLNENFRARFDALATRAALELAPEPSAEPLDFWLHNLWLDLRSNRSRELFAASDEGGVVLRVCEASATFCCRLEKKALETPGAHPQQKPKQNERLKSTVTSPSAARQMEAYLESKAIGLTDFASRVGTTDRTLRAFRRNGKVRRDIFEAIAKQMGITKEALLNSD